MKHTLDKGRGPGWRPLFALLPLVALALTLAGMAARPADARPSLGPLPPRPTDTPTRTFTPTSTFTPTRTFTPGPTPTCNARINSSFSPSSGATVVPGPNHL